MNSLVKKMSTTARVTAQQLCSIDPSLDYNEVYTDELSKLILSEYSRQILELESDMILV